MNIFKRCLCYCIAQIVSLHATSALISLYNVFVMHLYVSLKHIHAHTHTYRYILINMYKRTRTFLFLFFFINELYNRDKEKETNLFKLIEVLLFCSYSEWFANRLLSWIYKNVFVCLFMCLLRSLLSKSLGASRNQTTGSPKHTWWRKIRIRHTHSQKHLRRKKGVRAKR